MAKLYVVGTPIGNLGDVTLRAIDVLKKADFVLAEDTRVAKRLLSHFGLEKRVFSYSEHSHKKILPKILELLKEGKNLALVSDAGTPGVSDPGMMLVKEVWAAGFAVVPIPGPSALLAIISVSDIQLSEFSFFGFPPHKKGREKFFKMLQSLSLPAIIFESPHRILKTLRDIENFLGDRYLNIGRELTKVHEEVFRGTASEAAAYFKGEKERGEFVIVAQRPRRVGRSNIHTPLANKGL